MAQDTALLRYLLRWARRTPWSWSQRDLAFAFDWIDDYISSNATIGRTGYDMNVAGNVTTGSDADGSYIQFNGNRDATAATWTIANLQATTALNYTQANSFTMKVRCKVISNPAHNASWLLASNFDWWILIQNWASVFFQFALRWSTLTQFNAWARSLNTMYDLHLVYNAVDTKFYCYIDWVLQNTWWTLWPATFTLNDLNLWDNAVWWWNVSSANKYIYHAAIRNKALTQAEIDADIALWNTSKNDPSIVAYYIPENLQYNTQYITQPKALDQSPWWSAIWAITPDYAVAPDWTTTADRILYWWWWAGNVQQTITTLTGSNLASKTFIIKAFVKSNTWSHQFRFRLAHNGVADYLSWNITATTTRQEFTFVQTFTSSTAWTWIDAGFVSNTTLSNPVDISVRNVRVFLVNETLRDESPNIWWFIWWKTQKVLSCRYKPNADFADSATAWWLMVIPRAYMHDRTTDHRPQIRYDDRVAARTSIATPLWAWFRGKVHVLWMIYRTWSAFATKFYTNGVLVDSDTRTAIPASNFIQSILEIWRRSTTYFSWNIRDARVYTFTWSFTDADALAIYNGGEPTSAWVTKYLHYRPPVGEVGTTTQDQSSNDRDWTLNNWVTRDYI